MVTASIDEEALAELGGMGDVTYSPWREEMRVLNGGRELVEALEGFEVLITEMDVVDFEALKDLPGLKAIICCRVDAVNVNLEAATAFGIPAAIRPR